jgi:hypothetical protein
MTRNYTRTFSYRLFSFSIGVFLWWMGYSAITLCICNHYTTQFSLHKYGLITICVSVHFECYRIQIIKYFSDYCWNCKLQFSNIRYYSPRHAVRNHIINSYESGEMRYNIVIICKIEAVTKYVKYYSVWILLVKYSKLWIIHVPAGHHGGVETVKSLL